MEFISLAILGILIVISPGADFVLVLKNSLNKGRTAGIWTALGVSLAICVHISYSLLGISYLISQNEWLFNGIRYAGSAYLIYLGIKGILAAGSNDQADHTPSHPSTQQQSIKPHRYLAQGFLCNVLNPKTMLFFLSIFSQVISPDSGTYSNALIYGVYMIVLHGIWFSAVAMLFTSQSLQQGLLKMKKRINQLCGAGLIGFGAMLSLKA
ncbi:lysine transporter LysE [Photobacterium jeanii]|uniref:Lysine transporter LysE n=1 Tax=Photobacterium jeanii TaxID=858640 RepID=A0A178K778_9GAMM|nr:LysE family translocator [Photobacterium jeanii]OAN13180.1 lysine transporter LysE [Photobacterium jeanii]PST89332.1 LysE family translocator [Photobacterium jeanii]